ncbi:hypothetical protein AB0K74_30245 [Streptomyces sp. NPDC056159]|uniref:hypothetical protein n=1 Tax=Streptomyces sp. NPDC056159 TaxID=3155537 RepID=UPI0034220C58
MIADVRAFCVPNPAQHDETSASGSADYAEVLTEEGAIVRDFQLALHPDAAGGVSVVALSDHRLVSAALFEMHDEWIALPRRHLPEGDMGDIYRKLAFGSSVLPNAPKCNRQLIPNTMTRDTTWQMRVPDRVALASVSSRAGHRRPFTQRLLGS